VILVFVRFPGDLSGSVTVMLVSTRCMLKQRAQLSRGKAMASSSVIVFVAVGFLAGLASGAFVAYHLLATLGNIEAAIREVARRARPF
jgi:hypothetical protein